MTVWYNTSDSYTKNNEPNSRQNGNPQNEAIDTTKNTICVL